MSNERLAEEWQKVYVKEPGGLLFRDCGDTGIADSSFLGRWFFFKDSQTQETRFINDATLEDIEALPAGIIVLLDC